MIQKNQQKVSNKVPAGKVSCLLCGGFISVSGGDRARFIDHMTNEHDAKTDCHQVLLAACVLDEKEKAFLVKSTSRRLDSIGKNQKPNYSDSFLNKLSDNVVNAKTRSLPPSRAPRQPSVRPQPVRQQRSAPQQRIQRPAQPVQSSFLRGNNSISVSKVDMRRSCNMCQMSFPGPAALIEHMNRNHFNLPGGINIVTHHNNSGGRSMAQPVKARSQVVPVRSRPRVEVVKCPDCGKNVDKFKFAIHQQAHAQQRRQVRSKTVTLQKVESQQPPAEKLEDVELVEIEDDTDAASPGDEEAGVGAIEDAREGMETDPGEDQPETENVTAVRNEIEKLDTLELLDNLVNFLQT